jgi:CBS-domain-containing membrane protein
MNQIYRKLLSLQIGFARILKEFRALWRHYLCQSLLATVVVSLVFWLLSAEEAVIVASIGATAFIVFTMPNAVTASSRRVVGGHMTGLLCGILGAFVLQHWIIPTVFAYSVTVGLSTFLMVALDFEHPPGSGTALGVAISGFSIKVFVAVLTSVVVLSLVHHYMKKYLKDLV